VEHDPGLILERLFDRDRAVVRLVGAYSQFGTRTSITTSLFDT
jgi:hypothetical protein